MRTYGDCWQLRLTATALIGLTTPIAGQTHAVQNPSFEVSTIRPGNPDARNSNLNFGVDGVVSRNLPLSFILQFAYDLNTGSKDQIVGAPSWVSSMPFDIDAKEDEALAARIKTMSADERAETLRQMIQVLLADRFQLKVHHEMRDIPVLALIVAKGGPKVIPLVKPTELDGDASSHPDDWSGLHNPERGKTVGRDVPLKMLADALSSKPEVGDRIVIDRTGLQGHYNFILTWTPDHRAANTGSSDADGPSLFTALQEQLGLKLESRKAPVDCICDRSRRAAFIKLTV